MDTKRNWHDEYADPRSPLSVRLEIVRDELANALLRRPPGLIRVVSICAGEGRDVLGVLPTHPRRGDVSAVLLEQESAYAATACRAAAAAGLAKTLVVEADASRTDSYEGHVPADVVLVCGLFGNITDDEIKHTIGLLPQLCGPGADVIWTRNLGPRDGSANLTPAIRRWFGEAGFREVAFRWTDGGYGIGTHQLTSPPRPLERGMTLFTSFAQRW